MKKWKKLLAVVLCMATMQVPAFAVTAQAETTTQSAAATKVGLTKENGKWYFYSKNKTTNKYERVKNKWKTVNGYRYYFCDKGYAYMGSTISGLKNICVKTINGKVYGFDTNARMVKGTYVTIKGNFYVFSTKSGACDVGKTQNRRKAAKYMRSASTLRYLLGKPKKTTVTSSCYDTSGKDVILTYDHFTVTLFRDKTGKEFVFGAAPR